jgi:predicted transcriptional regulator
MRTKVAALQSSIPLKELAHIVFKSYPRLRQGLYPVADSKGHFVGVLTRSDIQKYVEEQPIKQTDA